MLELLLRVGVIGLVAFAAAVAVTWVISIRVWRWAPKAATAGVGAAVVMVFAAVLAKAMVEPALSKFRLGLFMGMALGCLAVAERTVAPAVERMWAGSTRSGGRSEHLAPAPQLPTTPGGSP